MKYANIYTVQEKCGRGGTGRRAGLRNQCQRRGGSSPLARTNDVSVRTFYRTERYKNQSVKWLIFLFVKIYYLAELHKSLIRTFFYYIDFFYKVTPLLHIGGVVVAINLPHSYL